MNNDPEFDPLVTEALGHYVYALFDPETGLPFYVGKGGGKEAKGNRRVLAHLQEARQKLGSREPLSAKTSTIHRIWASGKDVDWKIIRRGLSSEQEALVVEGALIDAYRAAKLMVTNEQSGHDTLEKGLIDRSDVYALAAPDFDPQRLPGSLAHRPIFLFNVDGGFRERGNYRLATVGHWSMMKKFAELPDAVLIGAAGQVSRCVIGTQGWRASPVMPKRYEAVPYDLTEEEQQALLHRNMRPIIDPCRGFWQRGGFIVFEVDENGRVTYRRGLGKRVEG